MWFAEAQGLVYSVHNLYAAEVTSVYELQSR